MDYNSRLNLLVFNKKYDEALCLAMKNQDTKNVMDFLETATSAKYLSDYDWNEVAGCAVEYGYDRVFNTLESLIYDWNVILGHAARAGNIFRVKQAIDNGAKNINLALKYASETDREYKDETGIHRMVDVLIQTTPTPSWLNIAIGSAIGNKLKLFKEVIAFINPCYYYNIALNAALNGSKEVFNHIMDNYSIPMTSTERTTMLEYQGCSFSKTDINRNFSRIFKNPDECQFDVDNLIFGAASAGNIDTVELLANKNCKHKKSYVEDVTEQNLYQIARGAGKSGSNQVLKYCIDRAFAVIDKDNRDEVLDYVIFFALQYAAMYNNIGLINMYKYSDLLNQDLEFDILSCRRSRLYRSFESLSYSRIKSCIALNNLNYVKEYFSKIHIFDLYAYMERFIMQAAKSNAFDVFLFMIKYYRMNAIPKEGIEDDQEIIELEEGEEENYPDEDEDDEKEEIYSDSEISDYSDDEDEYSDSEEESDNEYGDYKKPLSPEPQSPILRSLTPPVYSRSPVQERKTKELKVNVEQEYLTSPSITPTPQNLDSKKPYFEDLQNLREVQEEEEDEKEHNRSIIEEEDMLEDEKEPSEAGEEVVAEQIQAQTPEIPNERIERNAGYDYGLNDSFNDTLNDSFEITKKKIMLDDSSLFYLFRILIDEGLNYYSNILLHESNSIVPVDFFELIDDPETRSKKIFCYEEISSYFFPSKKKRKTFFFKVLMKDENVYIKTLKALVGILPYKSLRKLSRVYTKDLTKKLPDKKKNIYLTMLQYIENRTIKIKNNRNIPEDKVL